MPCHPDQSRSPPPSLPPSLPPSPLPPQSQNIHNLLPVLFTSFFLPSSSSKYAWVLSSLECLLFFRLLSHGIVSTDLVDTSMVVKRRFSSEVAIKFATQAPDQILFFIFPALVRALLGHRSPARAANGIFLILSVPHTAPWPHSPIQATCRDVSLPQSSDRHFQGPIDHF